MCSSRNKFTLFYQNSETDVFVGFRPPHVGAHPGGHLHGVSKQISINLGKIFLRLSRIRNILQTWILAGNLVYQPPFISQIPDFVYLNGSDKYICFLSILNGVSLKTSKYIYQICNMRAIYHRRMVCCPNIKSQPRSQVTPRKPSCFGMGKR